MAQLKLKVFIMSAIDININIFLWTCPNLNKKVIITINAIENNAKIILNEKIFPMILSAFALSFETDVSPYADKPESAIRVKYPTNVREKAYSPYTEEPSLFIKIILIISAKITEINVDI